MNYSDVLNNARQCIGKYCKACPVCNGVACKNQVPGPGAKGVGDTAIRNYNKWADSRFNHAPLISIVLLRIVLAVLFVVYIIKYLFQASAA